MPAITVKQERDLGCGLVDVVFAQKNGDNISAAGIPLTLIRAIDAALDALAGYYGCKAIRFCGRYGWQRFVSAFGYRSTGERSPRGYPYFLKKAI